MRPTEDKQTPGSWQVMIVEDNATVADLHRRIVDAVPHLRTVHVASNGKQALAATRKVQPNLVILDLAMPGGDGLPFLRALRQEKVPVDVIVVTASSSGRVVREVSHLGVIDYLVKPFSPQRLRQALSAFAIRNRALTGAGELSQAEVDKVRTSGVARTWRLPKGLREETLAAVVATLDAASEPLSAEEVGLASGVARVTARRYLEYLVLVRHVQMTRRTGGPGRPCRRYRVRARSA